MSDPSEISPYRKQIRMPHQVNQIMIFRAAWIKSKRFEYTDLAGSDKAFIHFTFFP